MGGLTIKVQSFGLYQAIEWLSSSESISNQVNAARRIRKMVDNGKAEDLMKLNVVSRLVERLEKTETLVVQSEIVHTLCNIAAGTSHHTEVVVRNALPTLLKILEESASHEVKADIIWTLANVAGDSEKCRDKLLDAGIMMQTVKLLDTQSNVEMEKNCIWLISNLCRHKNPSPDFGKISCCIPILEHYLKHSNDEIINNTCWALRYISDGGAKQIDALVEAGFCKRLVELFEHQSSNIVVASLLICINITGGSISQTQALLNCGLVSALSKLLKSEDQQVVKNSVFIISNVAAGNQNQVQELVNENIFSSVCEMFEACDASIRYEIMHVLNNATQFGDNKQILSLLECGCLEIFLQGLAEENDDSVKLAITGLFWILHVDPVGFDGSRRLDVVSAIKKLQTHKNQEICTLAASKFDKIQEAFP